MEFLKWKLLWEGTLKLVPKLTVKYAKNMYLSRNYSNPQNKKDFYKYGKSKSFREVGYYFEG